MDISNPLIMKLKEDVLILEEKISSGNKRRYNKNLELSRMRKTLNNSKQQIKRNWKNRKAKKALILKHIEIIRKIKGK